MTSSSMGRHDEWTREKYHMASEANDLYDHLKRQGQNAQVTVQGAQLALVRLHREAAQQSRLFPATRLGGELATSQRKMSLCSLEI